MTQLSLFEEPNQTPFDRTAHHTEQGQEYWSARELMVTLGYTEWRNFNKVIAKAIVSCDKGGNDSSRHFVDLNKMVDLGDGIRRKVKDYNLSRLACYLIAQNADPSKEIVAQAQTYFAVQTRRQEVAAKQKKTIPFPQTKKNRELLDSGYEPEQAKQWNNTRGTGKQSRNAATATWAGRGNIAILTNKVTQLATGKSVQTWKRELHIKVSPRNYLSTLNLMLINLLEGTAAIISSGRGSETTEELAQDIDTAMQYVDIARLRNDLPNMTIHPKNRIEAPRQSRLPGGSAQ